MSLCIPVGINVIEASQRAYNGAYSTPEKGWAAKTGPNNLIIVTSGGDSWAADYGLKIPFPYSHIMHSKSATIPELIQEIGSYRKKNGTIDELVIFAHGNSGIFSPNEKNRILTPLFLYGLISEQTKSKKPIARRIVFLSCDVLTNLTPADVGFYRYAAKKLNAEIVGATNTIVYGFGMRNTFFILVDMLLFCQTEELFAISLTFPTIQ